ncbi:MAG: hypothetical protein ACTHKG_01245 [Nocardioides sp.]
MQGVDGASARLARLGGQPLEAAEFSHEVDRALRQVLSYDGWCLFGTDPLSGMRTVQFGGRGTEHTAEMARNEALMHDVNRYDDLATAPCPAGWLSAEHPAAPTSFRLHEILVPQGFHSEIRLALRDGGRLWGALVLFSEDARRPLGAAEAAAVCAMGGPLTRALRGFQVRSVRPSGRSPGSGLVAIAPDDRLVSLSGDAQCWLDDLVPGGEDETYPSDVTACSSRPLTRCAAGNRSGRRPACAR